MEDEILLSFPHIRMSLQNNFIIGSTTVLSLVAMSSIAFAETPVTTSSAPAFDTVACSSAIDAENSAMGPALDAKNTALKSALTVRATALKSALALTDLSARKTALKTIEETFRTSMKTAEDAFKTAVKTSADALRTACPGLGRGFMGAGMMEPPRMMKGDKKGQKDFMGHMRGFFGGKKDGRAMPQNTESGDDR